uniref:Uncharacterized protein n=1 Tax=Anguilla anguilla TaxID=7936 RepID=A0A0E9SXF2_ANGAN
MCFVSQSLHPIILLPPPSPLHLVF